MIKVHLNEGSIVKLRVEAFLDKRSIKIPQKYTCDGQQITPGITWYEVPEKTKTFAILMEELDVANRSNPLVLWLVYNIPGTVREVPSNTIPEAALVGKNDLGKIGYSGPCPQPGPHHHRFRVAIYALDQELDLKPGATKEDFVHASKGHILAETDTIATYERHGK